MENKNNTIDINVIYSFENDPRYKVNINRPFSMFHNTSDDYEFHKFTKRGLAICHGHNHSMKTLKKIKFINYWYFIDMRPDTFPDYIADVADSESMKYFPDNYFYCILSEYCPVTNINETFDKLQFIDILKNVHRILNNDGYLLLTELPGLFFHFITNQQYNEIIDKVYEILGKDIIIRIIEQSVDDARTLPEELRKDYLKDIDIFNQILMGAYTGGPNSSEVNTYIKKISMKYTTNVLKKCGYKIIGNKGIFLLCKKIFNKY